MYKQVIYLLKGNILGYVQTKFGQLSSYHFQENALLNLLFYFMSQVWQVITRNFSITYKHVVYLLRGKVLVCFYTKFGQLYHFQENVPWNPYCSMYLHIWGNLTSNFSEFSHKVKSSLIPSERQGPGLCPDKIWSSFTVIFKKKYTLNPFCVMS